MSPQEQRIAIAEVVGWMAIVHHPEQRLSESGYKMKGGLWGTSPERTLKEVPNYLSDLNAMHEAVNKLKPDKMDEFCNCLIYDVVRRYAVDTDGTVKDAGFSVINATAAQRAEAFLRTVGRWKS